MRSTPDPLDFRNKNLKVKQLRTESDALFLGPPGRESISIIDCTELSVDFSSTWQPLRSVLANMISWKIKLT